MLGDDASDRVLHRFTLRYTFQGRSGAINQVAWLSNGRILVSPSDDKTIQRWDVEMGQHLKSLTGRTDNASTFRTDRSDLQLYICLAKCLSWNGS